jgi:hypothetical protein
MGGPKPSVGRSEFFKVNEWLIGTGLLQKAMRTAAGTFLTVKTLLSHHENCGNSDTSITTLIHTASLLLSFLRAPGVLPIIVYDIEKPNGMALLFVFLFVHRGFASLRFTFA